jgi:large subunit ribosomal protein L9
MKVIFLKDVPRVGKRHDIKEVNDGYAMNFLFPKKLAEPATSKAVAELEQRKKTIEIEKEVQDDLLMKNLEEIKGKVVHMKGKADLPRLASGKAGEKGHLFAAIHKEDIIRALKEQHHAEVSPDSIALEKPIKEIGEFEIPIKVKGKRSSFKLVVESIK